jgi:tRNA(Arg) A34 adenosine deaminase TadA
MCLSALVMNGIQAVYYAFDNDDAAPSAMTAARPTLRCDCR